MSSEIQLWTVCSVTHPSLTLCDFTDWGWQAPLSMGFSRKDYWSGLPCPPPEDLSNPLIKPRFPTMQEDSLPSEPPGKPSVKLPEIIGLLRRFTNNGEYPWDPINYSWKTSQNLPTNRRCGRTFNVPEKVPMQRCHL